MVRYIDNFSVGHRGSISAEKFLEAGYVVVFMHRKLGLLPYARQFDGNILDYLTVKDNKVIPIAEKDDCLLNCISKYHQVVNF